MKFINYVGVVMLFAVFSLMLGGCDKTKPYDIEIPPSQVHFLGAPIRTIQLADTVAPVLNLQVGTTDVASADRIVTYTITSPTGTVSGTDYSISTGAPSGTVTIAAGTATANIPIQANFAAFAIDQVDTLVFVLSTPSIMPAHFQDTVKVIIKGISSSTCNEANPTMSEFRGDFANTNEVFGTDTWGPYTTTISNAVLTTPTSGTIDVENIYDIGLGAIKFKLDWSDPSNPIATVIAGDVPGGDAGDVFGPTYAGVPLSVRPHPSQPNGTYSFCNQKLILAMQLGMASRGLWAQDVLVETLER